MEATDYSYINASSCHSTNSLHTMCLHHESVKEVEEVRE